MRGVSKHKKSDFNVLTHTQTNKRQIRALIDRTDRVISLLLKKKGYKKLRSKMLRSRLSSNNHKCIFVTLGSNR